MNLTTITTFVNNGQFAIGIVAGTVIALICIWLINKFNRKKNININSLKDIIKSAHSDMISSANKINELYKIILHFEK
jgi:hypothetical protein